MSSFDRDKFYKRIGFDPEQQDDQECIMVAELLTSEYGSTGLADKEEIALEKVKQFSYEKATSNMKIDYKAFCEKQGVLDEDKMLHMMEQRQLTTQEIE